MLWFRATITYASLSLDQLLGICRSANSHSASPQQTAFGRVFSQAQDVYEADHLQMLQCVPIHLGLKNSLGGDRRCPSQDRNTSVERIPALPHKDGILGKLGDGWRFSSVFISLLAMSALLITGHRSALTAA